MKFCNKCQQSKELAEFGKDKRNSDGRQGICNQCKNHDKQLHRDNRSSKNDYVVVANKQCNKCGLTKTSDLFFKDKAMRDGLSTICKACKRENVYKWRELNKEKYNRDMRAYQHANPEMRYGSEIKRKYGCTLEQYNQMLIAQEAKCAICRKLHNPAVKKGRLFVDHDHATGKVRALLCGGCNSGLGYFIDNTRLMLEAVAYIIKHRG